MVVRFQIRNESAHHYRRQNGFVMTVFSSDELLEDPKEKNRTFG